jgi:hypothetical protein
MQIVGPDYYLNLADASANHVNEKRKPRSDDVFGVTRFPSEEMHLTKILKHCKLTCYFSFIFHMSIFHFNFLNSRNLGNSKNLELVLLGLVRSEN